MSNETSEMSRSSGFNMREQSEMDWNTSGSRSSERRSDKFTSGSRSSERRSGKFTSGSRSSGRRSDYYSSGRNTISNELTKLSPGQFLVKAVASDITITVQLRDGEVITGIYSGATDGFIAVGDKNDIEPNDIVAFSL